MNSVNKTLYIPLYGKAFVSKKGIILSDKKAEEIVKNQDLKLNKKSKSKWLGYFLSMRAKVFDNWVERELKNKSDAIILHLGCGLDSRVLRVENFQNLWCDVDLKEVIFERKRYYNETENYRMIDGDLKDGEFINLLPNSKQAIIVLEGVSMYLTNCELQRTLKKLAEKFENLSVLIDCYTPFAVKMSKIKNPIKEVGVSKVYGIENTQLLEENTGLKFIKEHSLTPDYLIDELKSVEKFIFKHLYAGKISKKLYKLYEYCN